MPGSQELTCTELSCLGVLFCSLLLFNLKLGDREATCTVMWFWFTALMLCVTALWLWVTALWLCIANSFVAIAGVYCDMRVSYYWASDYEYTQAHAVYTLFTQLKPCKYIYTNNPIHYVQTKHTLEQCSTKWKSLRDKFVKELRKVKARKSGDEGPPYVSTWQLYELMTFLTDSVKHRQWVKINLYKA